jgi:hypothetical protein
LGPRVFGDNKRFVDEQRQLVQDLVALRHVGRRDRANSVQVESAEEHGQPAKQDAFGLAQQCV